MIKTIHIQTKSLEECGARANGLFSGKEGANIKTIVDGEQLAKDIEEQSNKLIQDGYQIISILPVTSQKLAGNALHATYTSSIIITGLKS